MKKLNLNIQGLRGVCALMVFGGHVTAAFDNPWLYSQYNPLRALLDGHAAVIFFFMLSGYFYYTNQCISLKKYAKMFVKRVLHLTPPYWLSIVIGALLCNYFFAEGISAGGYASEWMRDFWQEPVTLNKFLADASIVMRRGASFTFINPPSWYLTSDFKAMLVIPLVILFLNKSKWMFAPVIIIAMVVFAKYWFLGIFLMGAILHKYQNTVFALYDKYKFLVPLVAILGFVLWEVDALVYRPNYENVREACCMEMLEAFGMLLLLSVILQCKELPILSSKPLVYMGKISYEFYIIHFMLLIGLIPFISNYWLYIALCLVGSLLMAILLRKVVGLIPYQKILK